MRTRQWAALAATSLLALSGCVTTKVASTWRDPTAQSAQLNKVLVVAMVPREAVRRNFEDNLANQLAKTGTAASASYRFVEDGNQMTADKLKELAAREGFDGVLIARYAGTEVDAVYVPNTYYDYVGWSARYLYGPAYYGGGYVETYETVNLDTRLFDVEQGGKLIWAAVTQTTGNDNIQSHTRQVAEKIIQRLDHDVAI